MFIFSTSALYKGMCQVVISFFVILCWYFVRAEAQPPNLNLLYKYRYGVIFETKLYYLTSV